MGKPKELKPSLINTNYDWGEFGNANKYGVNLSPAGEYNAATAQSGINQYVNNLINPSYDSESFLARQNLLNQASGQRASTLLSGAMGRNARGSASQAILNSVLSSRADALRNAMTDEDTRVRDTISALTGIEGNYFNQSNAMARDIISRVLGNQLAQNEANKKNAEAYNKWRDNLFQGTGGAIGAAIGAYFGGGQGAALGAGLGTQAGGMTEGFFN